MCVCVRVCVCVCVCLYIIYMRVYIYAPVRPTDVCTYMLDIYTGGTDEDLKHTHMAMKYTLMDPFDYGSELTSLPLMDCPCPALLYSPISLSCLYCIVQSVCHVSIV